MCVQRERQASVSPLGVSLTADLCSCVPRVLTVSCLLDQSISDEGVMVSAGEPFGVTPRVCHSAFFFILEFPLYSSLEFLSLPLHYPSVIAHCLLFLLISFAC